MLSCLCQSIHSCIAFASPSSNTTSERAIGDTAYLLWCLTQILCYYLFVCEAQIRFNSIGITRGSQYTVSLILCLIILYIIIWILKSITNILDILHVLNEDFNIHTDASLIVIELIIVGLVIKYFASWLQPESEKRNKKHSKQLNSDPLIKIDLTGSINSTTNQNNINGFGSPLLEGIVQSTPQNSQHGIVIRYILLLSYTAFATMLCWWFILSADLDIFQVFH